MVVLDNIVVPIIMVVSVYLGIGLMITACMIADRKFGLRMTREEGLVFAT